MRHVRAWAALFLVVLTTASGCKPSIISDALKSANSSMSGVTAPDGVVVTAISGSIESSGVAAGSVITLTGSGFTSDLQVAINGVSCSPVVVPSATILTCTATGAIPAGGPTIVLTKGSGSSGSSSGAASVSQSPTPTPTSISASWPFALGTESSYTYSPNVEISTLGYARLRPLYLTDSTNSVTYGYAAGTHNGTTYAALSDGSSGLKLASSTTSNFSELDSSWTPQWGSISAYWKLNNNWNDAIGTRHGAATSGAATFASGARLGTAAGSFASGALVTTAGSNSYEFAGNYSIQAWVYLNTLPAIWTTVFGTWTGNGSQASWSMGFNANGAGGTTTQRLFFQNYEPGATQRIYTTNNTISLNRWHHIVLVRSGVGTVVMYIDGVSQSYFTYNNPSALTADAQTVSIGGLLGTPVDGKVDDLAIWSTALTAAEVKIIYERQRATYAATFTSRIADAGASQAWTSLSWTPTFPTLKALPNAGVSESTANYPALTNSNLMTAIAGLWHFDEALWNGTASEVVDASGNTKHGVRSGSATTTSTDVKFGSAGTFDGTSGYVTVGNFDLATLSFAAWVKRGRTSGAAVDRLFMPVNAGGWGVFFSTNRLAFGKVGTSEYDSIATLTDTESYHHVAVTYSGTSVCFYIDGTLDQCVGATDTFNSSGGSYTLGSRAAAEYFQGLIDEPAVWSRVLSAAEVTQLYRRGVTRTKFQVRSCAAANCAGAAWLGPDGTSATYFSELYNTTGNSATAAVQAGLPTMTFGNFGGLTVSNNRYFQYRAILESDDSASSPELKSIAVGPTTYDASSPTIAPASGVAYTTLSAVTEVLGSCAGGVTYVLSRDGTIWYYWNGSAWTVSNSSLAQSSTRTVLNANIATFPTAVGTGNIVFKAFLTSNGAVPCELDSLSLSGTN